MFSKDKPEGAEATEAKPEKSHGGGNSTGTYYKVEVRSTHEPRVLQHREQSIQHHLLQIMSRGLPANVWEVGEGGVEAPSR